VFVNHTPSGHSVLVNECKKETGQGRKQGERTVNKLTFTQTWTKKKKKDEIKHATLRDGESVR